jgi:hypothetical protein
MVRLILVVTLIAAFALACSGGDNSGSDSAEPARQRVDPATFRWADDGCQLCGARLEVSEFELDEKRIRFRVTVEGRGNHGPVRIFAADSRVLLFNSAAADAWARETPAWLARSQGPVLPLDRGFTPLYVCPDPASLPARVPPATRGFVTLNAGERWSGILESRPQDGGLRLDTVAFAVWIPGLRNDTGSVSWLGMPQGGRYLFELYAPASGSNAAPSPVPPPTATAPAVRPAELGCP